MNFCPLRLPCSARRHFPLWTLPALLFSWALGTTQAQVSFQLEPVSLPNGSIVYGLNNHGLVVGSHGVFNDTNVNQAGWTLEPRPGSTPRFTSYRPEHDEQAPFPATLEFRAVNDAGQVLGISKWVKDRLAIRHGVDVLSILQNGVLTPWLNSTEAEALDPNHPADSNLQSPSTISNSISFNRFQRIVLDPRGRVYFEGEMCFRTNFLGFYEIPTGGILFCGGCVPPPGYRPIFQCDGHLPSGIDLYELTGPASFRSLSRVDARGFPEGAAIWNMTTEGLLRASLPGDIYSMVYFRNGAEAGPVIPPSAADLGVPASFSLEQRQKLTLNDRQQWLVLTNTRSARVYYPEPAFGLPAGSRAIVELSEPGANLGSILMNNSGQIVYSVYGGASGSAVEMWSGGVKQRLDHPDDNPRLLSVQLLNDQGEMFGRCQLVGTEAGGKAVTSFSWCYVRPSLLAQLQANTNRVSPGRTFRLTATVENRSGAPLTGVFPSPDLDWTGDAGLRVVSGPDPAAPQALGVGTSTQFEWTVEGTNSGSAVFQVQFSADGSPQPLRSFSAFSGKVRIALAADLLVRADDEDDLAFRGDNQYQEVPFNDQNLTLGVGTNGAARYLVRLENDSARSKSFNLRTTTNSFPAWAIRIRAEQQEITQSLFSSGGWNAPALAPGGHVDLTVAISPGPGAGHLERKSLLIRSFEESSSNDTLDAVLLHAQLQNIVVTGSLHKLAASGLTPQSIAQGRVDIDAPLVPVPDPSVLTAQPRIYGGLVADGVTPLVLKFAADPKVLAQFAKGQNFDIQARVKEGGGVAAGSFDRQLRVLNHGAWTTASNLLLTAQQPEGFIQVLPLASDDFQLSYGYVAAKVQVSLLEHDTGDVSGSVEFGLRKPPLFLTHGYNTKGGWGRLSLQEFARTHDADLFLCECRYGQDNFATAGPLSQRLGTAMVNTFYPLDALAPLALEMFDQARKKVEVNWALTRHDVAAHSQGGLLTRMLCSVNGNGWVKEPFRNAGNFYRGRFHRVVTLGSPHNGTRLLRYLLSLTESLSRKQGLELVDVIDLIPSGIGKLMVTSGVGQEKFDPWGHQIQELNNPDDDAPWRPDPGAKFHLVRTTSNHGFPPTAYSGSPADFALGLADVNEPVTPRGSDGVVDWDSMAAQGPGAPVPLNSFTLSPELLVSHAGPVFLFGAVDGQVDSAEAARHIQSALHQDPALPPSLRTFGPFQLPPLLGNDIRDAIDAWAKNIEVLALNFELLTNGPPRATRQSQGNGISIRLSIALPAGVSLPQAPGWTVEVYGPDGITTTGVTIEPNISAPAQAIVTVADSVIGDVMVRVGFRGSDGVTYLGRPLRVLHRDPPGVRPVALASEFDRLALPVGAWVPIRLGVSYSNNLLMPIHPEPAELEVTTDSPGVVDITVPTRWRIVGSGIARVQVTYRGLSRSFDVTGFAPVEPSEGDFVADQVAAGIRLRWPVHPRSSLQASDNLDPAPGKAVGTPGILDGVTREVILPADQPAGFFRLVPELGPMPPAGAATMEWARYETRTDAAVAEYGVTGRGVLIAVMDRGLDWRNADFQNPDGTTRIRYIFDLTDNSGANAPGNPYGVGTIYTAAQVNTALKGGPGLPFRDAVGHGTTTTAIACGGGRNDPRFAGIAPGADILCIKVTSDGAPAHDSELAEAGFNRPDLFPKAIDFARDKAAELRLPCVMLLNLGSVIGPTDGTSELCRKIDAIVGSGIPGLVFVTGTSDDGGAANRVGGTIQAGKTVTLGIHKGLASSMDVDLWYASSDAFSVRVVTPVGNFGPYKAPALNNYDLQKPAPFTYYQLTPGGAFYGAQNDRREIWFRIGGPAGEYSVEITGNHVENGRFDGTMNPSRFTLSENGGNYFRDHLAAGSIWDGAMALHAVVPNSYLVATNYTDIDGVLRFIIGEGKVGELWRGSGIGPTFDGRLGIDVSAPGDSVFTTYNPKSYWATFRYNLVKGTAGTYGRASAVSAANPLVTGVIALMLERNPHLDAMQVKEILHRSALPDRFTGSVPNTRWGYGKLNALEAVRLATDPPTTP